MTVKLEELVAVPPVVVSGAAGGCAGGDRRRHLPVVHELKLAEVPLNLAVTPVKRSPLIVTEVPTLPLVGAKLLIVGRDPGHGEVDPLVAVPAGVVTEIRARRRPRGTVAVTLPSFTKLKVADAPLNLTAFAPVKSFLLIMTVAPTTPLVGEKPLIVGALVSSPVKLKRSSRFRPES